MDVEAIRRCKELTERAFELTKHYAAADEREIIAEFIYVGEWGLAVESIIDMLLEEEISVTSAEKASIIEAANEMGLSRGQMNISTQT